jgi:hypothetical protein
LPDLSADRFEQIMENPLFAEALGNSLAAM